MRIPPLSQLRQFDTHRLIPTRFVETEDSVLFGLSEDENHLKDLFDLDNATNQRLIGEVGGLPGIGVDELVFGIPNFRIINAAFTYPRPEGSRFNDGKRGAWYCSFNLDAALSEVIFHKTVEYHEIGWFEDSITYQGFLADFTSEFHDLRGQPGYMDCLAPDSYIASQELANNLLGCGSLGVIYPSVRHADGVNLACFRPALIGNVRKGSVYQISWKGTEPPRIEVLESVKLTRAD